jgi:hypothetical protein
MNKKLIISIGMPRAGSGWHYNLVHDLIVARGGKDARQIRSRFHLHNILTEVNCNIGALTTRRMVLVLIPVIFGNTYVIKAHAGPKPLALSLINRNLIRATYIYRDPRDALLSAFEYGQRGLNQGRPNAFSSLTTIHQAIDFMKEYVRISDAWLACPKVLDVRYEELLVNYSTQVDRLLEFLNIDNKDAQVVSVVEKYRPERGEIGQSGTHFIKGKTGRFRQKLTSDEQKLCLDVFGSFLKERGYIS